mmetsp:Transcript_6746/g.12060  ORF Transcript_6746/g.12060 Transcript_6746/m.12060 type:complete len:226 (-) Transcript_6746:243-920(-)
MDNTFCIFHHLQKSSIFAKTKTKNQLAIEAIRCSKYLCSTHGTRIHHVLGCLPESTYFCPLQLPTTFQTSHRTAFYSAACTFQKDPDLFLKSRFDLELNPAQNSFARAHFADFHEASSWKFHPQTACEHQLSANARLSLAIHCAPTYQQLSPVEPVLLAQDSDALHLPMLQHTLHHPQLNDHSLFHHDHLHLGALDLSLELMRYTCFHQLLELQNVVLESSKDQN